MGVISILDIDPCLFIIRISDKPYFIINQNLYFDNQILCFDVTSYYEKRQVFFNMHDYGNVNLHIRYPMVLINTYENQYDAELALSRLNGVKRLASERDDNEVVYNLFGDATWTNLHAINLFRLNDLKLLINGGYFEPEEILAISAAVKMAARIFSLKIPCHWAEALS